MVGPRHLTFIGPDFGIGLLVPLEVYLVSGTHACHHGFGARSDDSVHHPTEVMADLAEQQGAGPAAQLNSREKKSNQEAA
jgi:hypothetical protein